MLSAYHPQARRAGSDAALRRHPAERPRHPEGCGAQVLPAAAAEPARAHKTRWAGTDVFFTCACSSTSPSRAKIAGRLKAEAATRSRCREVLPARCPPLAEGTPRAAASQSAAPVISVPQNSRERRQGSPGGRRATQSPAAPPAAGRFRPARRQRKILGRRGLDVIDAAVDRKQNQIAGAGGSKSAISAGRGIKRASADVQQRGAVRVGHCFVQRIAAHRGPLRNRVQIGLQKFQVRPMALSTSSGTPCARQRAASAGISLSTPK